MIIDSSRLIHAQCDKKQVRAINRLDLVIWLIPEIWERIKDLENFRVHLLRVAFSPTLKSVFLLKIATALMFCKRKPFKIACAYKCYFFFYRVYTMWACFLDRRIVATFSQNWMELSRQKNLRQKMEMIIL